MIIARSFLAACLLALAACGSAAPSEAVSAVTAATSCADEALEGFKRCERIATDSLIRCSTARLELQERVDSQKEALRWCLEASPQLEGWSPGRAWTFDSAQWECRAILDMDDRRAIAATCMEVSGGRDWGPHAVTLQYGRQVGGAL